LTIDPAIKPSTTARMFLVIFMAVKRKLEGTGAGQLVRELCLSHARQGGIETAGVFIADEICRLTPRSRFGVSGLVVGAWVDTNPKL
jgi:hypothetical protein